MNPSISPHQGGRGKISESLEDIRYNVSFSVFPYESFETVAIRYVGIPNLLGMQDWDWISDLVLS